MMTTKLPPFTVHSTFRDENGHQVKPRGLQWDLFDGDSLMTYYCEKSFEDTPENRFEIIKAHNKWCFAKDIPFQHVSGIEKLKPLGNNHVQVDWKDPAPSVSSLVQVSPDKAKNVLSFKKNDSQTKYEVWINGDFMGFLSDETLPVIEAHFMEETAKVTRGNSGPRWLVKFQKPAASDDGIIRLERSFRGAIRQYHVYQHILDNLYALEDPQVLSNPDAGDDDSITLIGTVTLPDWIMGGELTSRMWMQFPKPGEKGRVLFLRPLYDDDVTTSDRTFWVESDDKEKMAALMPEFERLTHLAGVEHPLAGLFENEEKDGMEEEVTEDLKRRRENQRKNRRKRFHY